MKQLLVGVVLGIAVGAVAGGGWVMQKAQSAMDTTAQNNAIVSIEGDDRQSEATILAMYCSWGRVSAGEMLKSRTEVKDSLSEGRELNKALLGEAVFDACTRAAMNGDSGLGFPNFK